MKGWVLDIIFLIKEMLFFSDCVLFCKNFEYINKEVMVILNILCLILFFNWMNFLIDVK